MLVKCLLTLNMHALDADDAGSVLVRLGIYFCNQKPGFDAAFSSNTAIPVRSCECHCTTSNGCILLAAHCVLCVCVGVGTGVHGCVFCVCHCLLPQP